MTEYALIMKAVIVTVLAFGFVLMGADALERVLSMTRKLKGKGGKNNEHRGFNQVNCE